MRYRIISYTTFAFLLILIFTFTVGRFEKSPARQAAEKHTETGKLLLDQKRYKEAFKEFEKAIALDKAYVPAHESLVLTCLTCLDMFEEATEVLQHAAGAIPDDGNIHFSLGILQGMKNSHEEAIKEYTRAIELGIKHADVHYNLGVSYGQMGRHKEAVASYKKALELDPNNSDLRYTLGVEHVAANDFVNARKELQIAVRLDPNRVRKLFLLAFACYKMRNYAEAMQNLKKIIDVDPNARGARQVLGECYVQLGDMEAAKRMLFGELARFPDDAHSHFLLGQIYSTQEQTAAAVKEFRKAIKLDEDGRTDEDAHIDERTHILDEKGRATHTYYYGLAQALFKQGKADEAKQVMRDSEELRKKELDREYRR